MEGRHRRGATAGNREVPLDLLGLITGLPAEAARIPWDGPTVRIIEHQAHAPGHAALLIEERGVLVAGDMLSDVLIPMLDLNAADPIEDYLAALRLLEGVADDVDVVVPGHGSIGGADQLRARIDQDRAYVHALRDADVFSDPRIGPSAKPGWDWVSDVHAGQLQRFAQRSERDGTLASDPPLRQEASQAGEELGFLRLVFVGRDRSRVSQPRELTQGGGDVRG